MNCRDLELRLERLLAGTLPVAEASLCAEHLATCGLCRDLLELARLSDAAAALVGGLGLASSANASDNFVLAEPVHGSAPDIAGQGKADPTAAILSAALLLRHLGRTEDAERVEKAVAADVAERGDGPLSTVATGDRILARV